MRQDQLSRYQHSDCLRCPIDHGKLAQRDSQLVCSQGHSFDLSKYGYVNLLPVQNKRSRDPGDSKAMVAARQQFLAAGHYQPLAEKLSALSQQLLQQCPSSETPTRILDAGCGEGYYLAHLRNTLADSGRECLFECSGAEFLGVDISKWAVQAAARQHLGCTWLVASNRNLPVADASIDQIICGFGFPVFEEFARVLKPGGSLIMLDPTADHLAELKTLLYENSDTAPGLGAEPDSKLPYSSGLKCAQEESLTQIIPIQDRSSIKNLIEMTPHAHRANRDRITQACELASLNITISTRYRVWTKT